MPAAKIEADSKFNRIVSVILLNNWLYAKFFAGQITIAPI